MIRNFQTADLSRVKEITAICFEGVSIDRNIEEAFGVLGGKDWRWRKLRHLDADTSETNAQGVFVYEEDGQLVGYITCRTDAESKIGWIPNMAVIPESQGKGIGRKFVEHVFNYFREEGMEVAKIETLDQNPIGQVFYPSMGFEEVAKQIHYAKKL